MKNSWTRGILMFIAAILLLGAALALVIAWLLASDQSIKTLSIGYLDFEAVKARSESIAASLGLVLGAAVSLAGSLVAIYLASLASDVQTQQFKLEFMNFIDAEFDAAKEAFARHKRALLALHDFVYLRDDVMNRVLKRKSLHKDDFATVGELVQAAEHERLVDAMRSALSELALATLSIQESSLASSLRNTAFKANISKFNQFFDGLSSKYVKSLRHIDEGNLAYHQRMGGFGGMLPSKAAQDILDQRKAEMISHQSLFSEVRAKITAETIVWDFIAAYNVAAMRGDEIACNVAASSGSKLRLDVSDYINRNVLVGLSSLLGHDGIQMNVIDRRLSEKFFEYHSEESVAITGVFELAKLYWSTPSESDTRDVCTAYIKSIAPDDVQISKSLEAFVSQKIHEMVEASRDVIGLEPIIELNALPAARIFEPKKFKVSDPEFVEE